MSGIQKFDATPVRPSTPAYAPGTVAVANFGEEANVRVSRYSHGWARLDNPDDFINDDDRYSNGDVRVTDVRPLILLDLDECYGCWAETRDPSVIVQRLRNTQSAAAQAIADQIEQQTREPKPAEPTGLGAVVEDSDGLRWVRSKTITTVCHWKPAAGGRRVRWSDLPASVRVLNEGVQ